MNLRSLEPALEILANDQPSPLFTAVKSGDGCDTMEVELNNDEERN